MQALGRLKLGAVQATPADCLRVPCWRNPEQQRVTQHRFGHAVRRARQVAKAQSSNWNPLEGIQKAIQQVVKSQDGAATAVAEPPAEKAPAAAGQEEEEETEEKSDEYTAEMQQKMGTTLTYRHEDGINWNTILPDLVVGSCLQTPEDADRLAAAGITTVFSLQEDCDMDYFGIKIAAIQERCKEVGIKHVRFPVRDFDPFDLRMKLPKAVSKLAGAHDPRTGIAYIHCTAGLGRAPATALAYMYWLRGWDLNEALDTLTGKRRCSPRIESIRAATADLLTGTGPLPTTIAVRRRGTAESVQVAGLDVGWHSNVDLAFNPKTQRLEVTRDLLPGSYPFKFVVDGVWTASADYETYQDGANINNIITVLPRVGDNLEVRERLLSPTGKLNEQERLELAAMLCPWESHDMQLHLEPGMVVQPTLAQRVAATEAVLSRKNGAKKATANEEGKGGEAVNGAAADAAPPVEDAANSSY